MRMWNVNPKLMCRKHLLGEHVETHMFLSTIKQGKKIDGFIKNNLVEVDYIIKRHNELVEEMIERGYNHKSPIDDKDNKYLYVVGKVYIEENIKELSRRCKDCNKLIKSGVKNGR